MKTKSKLFPDIPNVPDGVKPNSRQWKQPDKQEIRVDGFTAYMSLATFQRLRDRTELGLPQGKPWPGKMWRKSSTDGWFLCWYSESKLIPGCCEIRLRQIVIDGRKAAPKVKGPIDPDVGDRARCGV